MIEVTFNGVKLSKYIRVTEVIRPIGNNRELTLSENLSIGATVTKVKRDTACKSHKQGRLPCIHRQVHPGINFCPMAKDSIHFLQRATGFPKAGGPAYGGIHNVSRFYYGQELSHRL